MSSNPPFDANPPFSFRDVVDRATLKRIGFQPDSLVKQETVSMDMEPSPLEKKTPVLKFYLVERSDKVKHEEFSGQVVAAYSEDDARTIHPWGSEATKHEIYAGLKWVPEDQQHTLEVTELVPEHFTRGVVCSEFNGYVS